MDTQFTAITQTQHYKFEYQLSQSDNLKLKLTKNISSKKHQIYEILFNSINDQGTGRISQYFDDMEQLVQYLKQPSNIIINLNQGKDVQQPVQITIIQKITGKKAKIITIAQIKLQHKQTIQQHDDQLIDLLQKDDNSLDADNIVATVIQKCSQKEDLSSGTVKELLQMIAMAIDKIASDKKGNFAIELQNKEKLISLENQIGKIKKNMNKRKNSGQPQAQSKQSNLKLDVSDDITKQLHKIINQTKQITKSFQSKLKKLQQKTNNFQKSRTQLQQSLKNLDAKVTKQTQKLTKSYNTLKIELEQSFNKVNSIISSSGMTGGGTGLSHAKSNQQTPEGQQKVQIDANKAEYFEQVKEKIILAGKVSKWADLSNLEKLDLTNKGIDELPQDLLNLKQLKVILLNSNSMFTLPSNIRKLAYLKQMQLKNNKISELPQSIGNLKQLSTLWISDNLLQGLPDSFCNLTQLRLLYAQTNRFESLSENFGNLKTLKTLWMYDNKLEQLPESFGNLKSLEQLQIHKNKFVRLPESFGNLKYLQKFYIHTCQLESLPQSFGNLKSLKFLQANDNKMQSLPQSMGNLKSLTLLKIYNNLLQSLPDNIGSLRYLKQLSMYENKLDILPQSFGNLKQLETLVFTIIPSSQIVCKSIPIVQLTGLKKFTLNYYRLEQDDIDYLVKLCQDKGVQLTLTKK